MSASRMTAISFCPTPTVSTSTSSNPMAENRSAAAGAAADSPPSSPRLDIERMNTPGSVLCSAIRTRSPSSAPPLNGLDGSTASTATRRPAARYRVTIAVVRVDLPTPGGPVMPVIVAARGRPTSGAGDLSGARATGLDPAEQPRDGPHRPVVRCPEQVLGGRPRSTDRTGNRAGRHARKPNPLSGYGGSMSVDEQTALPGSGISITAIDHVGIAVPDLAAAIEFHTTVLGGVLAHRERNEEQGVEEAMIAYGDGAQVQLLAPLTADSTIGRFIERNGPGLQQLAYRVTDVRQAAQDARAAGVRTLYDEPRRGTAGSSINFLHPKDTGGVLVELVQPPAAH